MKRKTMSMIANIGPRGRRMRLIVGAVALFVAAGFLVVVDRAGFSPGWTLAGFPILWFGILGVLQARTRTCVALAARRTCDEEIGPLTAGEAEILARRGRAILLQATVAAAAITLAVLLVFSYR